MMLKHSLWISGFFFFGNIYCTSDISRPTPVYVVQGGEAILQCGFESNGLSWYAHTNDLIASGADITNKSKYNISKNPSTGLYYRLHILNVGVSDLVNYKCSGNVNGVIQQFYFQLIYIVQPTSLSIENVASDNKLLGTQGQDLTLSCKAVGGKPAPNVILIIDEQTLENKTQAVQRILTAINRSYDGKSVTCQASHADYSQIPMTVSAVIYLNLKPLTPMITGYAGSIEETKPLVVTCTTTGSRPRATIQWTLGQQDVTSNATAQSSHITASDSYTVISKLTYNVGRSDHGLVLTCKAVNMAASSGIQATKTLNVTYAPTVSVHGFTYDQSEATRIVNCVPVGNPNTYTYYKWQHKSKYGVQIREMDGGTNGVLTLSSNPDPVEDRYQDSGEYVCTAGNGIVGRDGKVKQTGSDYVIINGMSNRQELLMSI